MAFPVRWAIAHFSGDFWRPVSASRNSAPGDPGWSANNDRIRSPDLDFSHRRNSGDLGPVLQLFRIESERLKLSAPFSRRIAEPLDADAAWQATFYCCFDKVGCEKCE
jgi:hypothetical protein